MLLATSLNFILKKHNERKYQAQIRIRNLLRSDNYYARYDDLFHLKTNRKMKQSKLKIAIGILLLPLVFATFMADRIILLAIFWVDAPSIGTWIAKDKLWSMSIVRIVITGVIFGLFSLINWLI